MRRRVVDERTYLLLLDDVWYRVETAQRRTSGEAASNPPSPPI
jgi:hypothetical protein